MGAPLLIGHLNIALAEYLAFHPEQLPEGITVNPKSYLRTQYGYMINDIEDKPSNYSEKFETNIEFVEYGRIYYRYEVEYSVLQGIIGLRLLG